MSLRLRVSLVVAAAAVIVRGKRRICTVYRASADINGQIPSRRKRNFGRVAP
ncbi:MAG: hypothetical protein LUD43_00800 [Firmicutes bacterium]|nr:hypothetical protein [Bacillota bacterium]